MTVTQKHPAPLHPRLPTCDGNRFCRTTFLSSELCDFKTSGCINVSLIRFQTTFSSDERKRLFPCTPGCICSALIFSSTLSVRVTPFTQLLVESDILQPESFWVWAYFSLNFCKLLRLPLRNYWTQLFWLSSKQSRNCRIRYSWKLYILGPFGKDPKK